MVLIRENGILYSEHTCATAAPFNCFYTLTKLVVYLKSPKVTVSLVVIINI